VLWRVHRSLNTTLGLGSNRISIILQDTATGSITNNYRLTMHRHKADFAEPNYNSDATYAVCGLRQVSLPTGGHVVGLGLSCLQFRGIFKLRTNHSHVFTRFGLIKNGIPDTADELVIVKTALHSLWRGTDTLSVQDCHIAYLSSTPRAGAILSSSSLAPPDLSTLPYKRYDFRGKSH
jgi:hypothetical protein